MDQKIGCCLYGAIKTIEVRGICDSQEEGMCQGHSVKVLFGDNTIFEGPIDTLDLCSLINAISSKHLITAIDIAHIQNHGLISSPYFSKVPNVRSVIEKLKELN